MNLRDIILAAKDRPLTAVDVPEWGCTIHLRPMSAADAIAIAKLHNSGEVPFGDALVACACDADGNPLFTKADVPALNGKSMQVAERLSMLMTSLNRLDVDVADAKN